MFDDDEIIDSDALLPEEEEFEDAESLPPDELADPTDRVGDGADVE
jgi:hypothetical protein